MIKSSNNGMFSIPAAPSAGTAVAQSGSANTFGSYVQLTASTAEADYIVAVRYEATTTQVPTYLSVTIGTGAGGSETTVAVVDCPVSFTAGAASTQIGGLVDLPFPIPVATSTRVAVKTASSAASAINWNISLCCYKQADLVDAGIQEKADITGTQTGTVTISDGVVINRSSSNTNALALTGNGTGVGLNVVGGTTGGASTFTAGGGNTTGLAITGAGSGVGFTVTGGGSNGTGATITGGAGASAGLTISGQGSGHALTCTGGGSGGDGIHATGGSNSGHGISAAAGGGGHGIIATAGGSSFHGISATGGTSGNGFNAAGGTGGNGIAAVGNGAGHGISTTGGTTGHGIATIGGATSGDGINAVATTSGHGITATGVGTTKHGINATGGATTSHGISATGGGAGHGILATSGGGATGDGIAATAVSTNGRGLALTGKGTEAGLKTTGGLTGQGVLIVGGGTSGDGLKITTTSGHGINSAPVGTSMHGILTTGGNGGTSDGVKCVAGTGGVDIRGNITGTLTTVTNVTNQLTAAQIATGVWQDTTAGDFTVTGSIGKSVYVNAAPGTFGGLPTLAVDLTVGANVLDWLGTNVTATSTGTPLVAANLLRNGTAQSGATSTTIVLDSGAASVDGYYVGGTVFIELGPGTGQARTITAYNGSTKTATIDRAWIAPNPSAISHFVIVAGDGPAVDSSLRMDLIDAPNANAVTAIQSGLATGSSQTSILNAVNAITNVTARSAPKVPEWLVRPAAGSTVFRMYLYLYSMQGIMEDADSNTVTVHAQTYNGSNDLDSHLSSTTMTRQSAGVYYVDYTVNSTDAVGEALVNFSWAVSGSAMKDAGVAVVEDAETIATLNTVNTNVSTLLTRVGSPAGASLSADVAAVKSDTATTVTQTTAGATAGAVWNALTASYQVANSFGKWVTGLLVPNLTITPVQTIVAGGPIQVTALNAKLNSIMPALVFAPTDTDGAAVTMVGPVKFRLYRLNSGVPGSETIVDTITATLSNSNHTATVQVPRTDNAVVTTYGWTLWDTGVAGGPQALTEGTYTVTDGGPNP